MEKDWTEITATEADEIDDLVEEVIRLQERVRALERANEQPGKGFWIELIAYAFLFAVAIASIVHWCI